MRFHKPVVISIVFTFSILAGCMTLSDQEIYQKPDWLPGKLYTTVSVQENLGMFTECLQLSGLDKILDVSGSWSVFAPTDEAMKKFLAENNYASISDIPVDELSKIAEYHVIQNPWSLEQLKILGMYGWRKDEEGNSNPYAFKRETMFRDRPEKYWIKNEDGREVILLDSVKTNRYKKVYVQSRKYVPIFYDEYLKANSITSVDYQFYFNRAIEPGNVYYAGAKIIKSDILAENGFVHIIDKVISPLMNAKEFLEKEKPGESYKLFTEMVYWYYPDFEANQAATISQPEYRTGGIADTLWDLNYSDLAFDLHVERIDNINQTLVKHNGMFAPIDDAFSRFIDGILTVKSGFPHWPNHKSLPRDISRIIISPNFKTSPIYPSTNQYNEIFKTGKRYRQSESGIIRKEFGSNCTFIGLNTYSPDKVFTSVSGPVFCRPAYSIFRRAMLYSGATDAIAIHTGKLLFFPIPDYALTADSSLMINWIDEEKEIFNFRVLNKNTQLVETVGSSTLKNWILNQVGVSVSNVNGKETIRTLGGNNITWNHNDNTIQGTYPCTNGYKSDIVVTCSPFPLDEPADNGKTYTVGNWFRFSK